MGGLARDAGGGAAAFVSRKVPEKAARYRSASLARKRQKAGKKGVAAGQTG